MIPTFLDFQIVGPAVRPGRCSWIGVGLDLASRPLWRVARSPAPAAMHLRRPGRKVRPYSRAEDRAAETNGVPGSPVAAVACREPVEPDDRRTDSMGQVGDLAYNGGHRPPLHLRSGCERERVAAHPRWLMNQMVGRTIPSPPSSSTTGTRRVRDNAPYLYCSYIPNVAALERSDNVADRGHAFAGFKRGYLRNTVWAQRDSTGSGGLSLSS
jgi:hypothetical protein